MGVICKSSSPSPCALPRGIVHLALTPPSAPNSLESPRPTSFIISVSPLTRFAGDGTWLRSFSSVEFLETALIESLASSICAVGDRYIAKSRQEVLVD